MNHTTTPTDARKEAEALRSEASRLEAAGEGMAARYRRRMAEHIEMQGGK